MHVVFIETALLMIEDLGSKHVVCLNGLFPGCARVKKRIEWTERATCVACGNFHVLSGVAAKLVVVLPGTNTAEDNRNTVGNMRDGAYVFG